MANTTDKRETSEFRIFSWLKLTAKEGDPSVDTVEPTNRLGSLQIYRQGHVHFSIGLVLFFCRFKIVYSTISTGDLFTNGVV